MTDRHDSVWRAVRRAAVVVIALALSLALGSGGSAAAAGSVHLPSDVDAGLADSSWQLLLGIGGAIAGLVMVAGAGYYLIRGRVR